MERVSQTGVFLWLSNTHKIIIIKCTCVFIHGAVEQAVSISVSGFTCRTLLSAVTRSVEGSVSRQTLLKYLDSIAFPSYSRIALADISETESR